MKRRELLTTVVATGLGVPALAAQNEHSHKPMDGPMATATVSFGSWPTMAPGTPLAGTRFAIPNAVSAPNGHQLIPYEATIKAGGTVNFIVAGFHLIAVYQPGIGPDDIDASALVPNSSPPGLIDDPTGRIYLGIDPRRLPQLNPPPAPPAAPVLQDRVEVVRFTQPGRHLVICAVVPHWVNDKMHGWVKVLP
jgi:hypothetical protein